MHTHDVRAGKDRSRHRRRRPPHPLPRRSLAQQLPDKGLARGADQNRQAEFLQAPQIPNDLAVLFRGLAEPDARINHELPPPHPGAAGLPQRPAQPGLDHGQDVFHWRQPLHGPGRAPDMHQRQRHPVAPGHARHRRIEAQPADVVDHLRPGLEGGFGHLSLGGINRDRNAQPAL